jgi:hypothetical protein
MIMGFYVALNVLQNVGVASLMSCPVIVFAKTHPFHKEDIINTNKVQLSL